MSSTSRTSPVCIIIDVRVKRKKKKIQKTLRKCRVVIIVRDAGPSRSLFPTETIFSGVFRPPVRANVHSNNKETPALLTSHDFSVKTANALNVAVNKKREFSTVRRHAARYIRAGFCFFVPRAHAARRTPHAARFSRPERAV